MPSIIDYAVVSIWSWVGEPVHNATIDPENMRARWMLLAQRTCDLDTGDVDRIVYDALHEELREEPDPYEPDPWREPRPNRLAVVWTAATGPRSWRLHPPGDSAPWLRSYPYRFGDNSAALALDVLADGEYLMWAVLRCVRVAEKALPSA